MKNYGSTENRSQRIKEKLITRRHTYHVYISISRYTLMINRWLTSATVGFSLFFPAQMSCWFFSCKHLSKSYRDRQDLFISVIKRESYGFIDDKNIAQRTWKVKFVVEWCDCSCPVNCSEVLETVLVNSESVFRKMRIVSLNIGTLNGAHSISR